MSQSNSNTDRREILKAAAWAVPVIAMSVAAPVAAASEPTLCGLFHEGNNGVYWVYEDKIVIQFNEAPDIYEVNVRYEDGSVESFGTNYGTAPERGAKAWIVPLRKRAVWAQVHSISDHLGEVC